MIKQGVILASGLGSRLAENGHEEPKPLMPIGGIPLLERNINLMQAAGIEKVVIVVGFKHEMIEDYIKENNVSAVTVYNPDFTKKNGLSLIAASAKLDMNEPFLLSMSDHVFSDDYMKSFIEKASLSLDKAGTVLAVDRDIDGVFDLDDATKVFTEEDKIVEIGKEIEPYNAIDTGLFLCKPVIIEMLKDVKEKNGDASLSDGMKALADEGLFTFADMTGFLWQDVDTPDMMEEAEKRLAAYKAKDSVKKKDKINKSFSETPKVTELLDEIVDKSAAWCTEQPIKPSLLIMIFSAVSLLFLILGLKFDLRFFSLLILPMMIVSSKIAALSGTEDSVTTLFSSNKTFNFVITLGLLPLFFNMHVVFAVLFILLAVFPLFKKEFGFNFNISDYIPYQVKPFIRFELFIIVLLISIVLMIPSFIPALIYLPVAWYNCERDF